MTAKLTYVTQEGLEKLQAELHVLKTVRRRELANRIEEAKALGDISENAEYDEAKESLALVENRIHELEYMLNNVALIEEGAKRSETVGVGSTVEVDAQGRKRTYKIVGSNEADPIAGLISNESPMGGAFLGHKAGETVMVETPAGSVPFQILKVS
jgi:transcription elongation factor GreA